MRRVIECEYVVVGGGSAGCVLANRLTADGNSRVILLEAGPPDGGLLMSMPAGVYKTYLDPKTNWNYFSSPQHQLDNRRIPVPRGKVIGGSSSINSMVYMRGHPLDYDRWASESFSDWDFAHCLPYFKKAESSDRGASYFRGAEGPLSVEKGKLQSPIFDAFLEAAVKAGQSYSEDLNAEQPEGVARLDSTKRNGLRCSAAVAYLHPIRNRPNLRVETRATTTKVIIRGGRATGVQYLKNGKYYEIAATREVILSAGAINSPQILMLSGIGPGERIREVGLEVHHELPGVGENLQDHMDLALQFSCNPSLSIASLGSPINKLTAGIRWLANRTGIAASNIFEVGGIVRTNDDVRHGNLQYHLAPVRIEQRGAKMMLAEGFMLHLSQLRQQSRGSVRLRNGDPLAPPHIEFNFLSTEQDRGEFRQALRLTRDIIDQKPMRDIGAREVMPGNSVKSDIEIDQFVRQHAETEYHPSCTCKMGSGHDAVVDGDLKVHGLDGLRVVDASVMPSIVSANLNAPTIMIAERAADKILGNKPLEPMPLL